MKILVVGATGMVGQRVVTEAQDRGHQVVAASRSGREVAGASAVQLDLADTAALVAAIDDADASVLSVAGNRGGDQAAVIDAHRALIAAAPTKPFLVVGGAGSLEADGVLLKDAPGFPAAYKDESEIFTTILGLYREAPSRLPWTMISPAPVLVPRERTGKFTLGDDSPVGERITVEDLAVAIVDELENPAHTGRRFTAAN